MGLFSFFNGLFFPQGFMPKVKFCMYYDVLCAFVFSHQVDISGLLGILLGIAICHSFLHVIFFKRTARRQITLHWIISKYLWCIILMFPVLVYRNLLCIPVKKNKKHTLLISPMIFLQDTQFCIDFQLSASYIL